MISWDPVGVLVWVALWMVYWDIRDTHRYGTKYTSTFSYAILLIITVIGSGILVGGVIQEFSELNLVVIVGIMILSIAGFNVSMKPNQPFFVRLYGQFVNEYTRSCEGLPWELRIINPSQMIWNDNSAYIVDISTSKALFIPFDSMEELEDFVLEYSNPNYKNLSKEYCENCRTEDKKRVYLIERVKGGREHPERMCYECLQDLCVSCIESSDEMDEKDVLLEHL